MTKILGDRYEFDPKTDFLGSGTFGRAYRARDRRRFQEPCIVKQLRPELAERNEATWAFAKAAFEKEARKLQALGEKTDRIPSLLAFLDEVDPDDGQRYFYLVMQYIEGEVLAQEFAHQFQRGPFSETQTLALVLSLIHI